MARADDVFEEASTSMKDYVDSAESVKKQRKPRRSKRVPLLIILVLLLIAGGVWFFFMREKKSAQPSQTTSTNQETAEEPQAELVTETEQYVSQAFRLTLDHPTNWEVNDTITDQLAITSPRIKFKDHEGKSQDGRILIRIRNKGSKLIELPENSQIIAVRASEKMAYSKPSGQQRGQTYLSFTRLKDTGLDNVYITGDNGYEKDGFVPTTDIAKADPLVSVSFLRCSEPTCAVAQATALSVSDSEWEDNKFLQQAKTLLQSLVIS